MAKSKTPPPAGPTVSPQTGRKLLLRQKQAGETLLSAGKISNDAYGGWRNTTRQYIQDTFGEGHQNIGFFNISGPPLVMRMYEPSEEENASERQKHVSAKVSALGSMLEQLDTRIEIESESSEAGTISRSGPEPKIGNEVFIVHGHDSGLKEATARLIQTLGLTPIILHEQDDGGLTIIEKLEHHAAKASFAIVLLTGDDIGRAKSSHAGTERPRARQNVILELGIFIGLLSRKRVRIIYEDGVETPNDIDGVLYVKYDKEGLWKFGIGKALKGAGYSVSLDSI